MEPSSTKQPIDSADGGIAVIGMAGRFPGARDLESFWSNLRDGVESVRTLEVAELLAAGEPAELIHDPAYVPAGAPLDGIDQFDAGFFGMSPRDAAVFDPQHRLFLECAWEAFEHAGHVGSHIDGAVGVFASCGLSEYMFKNVLANADVATAVGEWLVRHTGNDTNFLATRVSYELNLTGPSLNVQTACSSSLVAIHLACQSLLNGECDVALAGGVVVMPRQYKGYVYREGEILSPDGHCRAFDEKAAGTVLSSAAGCVVLKPLAAALDDGDNVLAVVLGSAINNDGRAKVGYLAPSVDGQSAVISEALGVAGIDARQVTYVEAHGTGTLIGDPIEIAALSKAFRHDTADSQFCAIGSLKTNIGHTGEASGVAGFIKTVLALQHRAIPANLHFQSPNPQADFPNTPFFVNAQLRPWQPGPGGRRIAGITNLGAGGTNAHLLLAEAPPATTPPAAARADQLVCVSARSDEALATAVADLAAHLRSNPQLALADVAFTRLAGRRQFPARCAVVARTPEEAADALDGSDPRLLVRQHRRAPRPTIAFLIPGGGAQYAGMGRDLYDSEPTFRRVVDECADQLRRGWGLDLLAAMYPADPDVDRRALERPSIALPALFTTAMAMAALLESWGIRPDVAIGHSAGEYVAACLAGVFSPEDGLALVAERGRLFETLAPGSMLSVSRSEDDVRSWLPDGLDVAVVNSGEQCVVAGPSGAVARFEEQLLADGIECARVHIDVAAHSSMLEPILDEFATFCRSLTYGQPTLPWVSNLTGDWITAAEATDPMYWVAHLRGTVRFNDGIERLLAGGERALVEIGPGRTLVGLAQAAASKPVASTATLRHPKESVADVAFALRAVARLWAAGIDLDAEAIVGAGRRRVPLPTYPFERSRHWVDPDPVDRRPAARRGLTKLADEAEWFSVPGWRRSLPPAPPASRVCQRWLLVGTGGGIVDEVVEQLRDRGDVVQTVRTGTRFQRPAANEFVLAPAERDQWQQLVDILRSEGGLPHRIVHMSAVGNRPPWQRDALAAYDACYVEDYAGLIALADVLSAQADPFHLAVVTSGVHSIDGHERIQPERALLHGAARVIPHELANVRTTTVDLDVGGVVPAWGRRARLAGLLVRELDEPTDDDVAYRGGRRLVRAFDRIVVPAAHQPSWTDGAVVVITGGLGGIGLTVAEHVAARARGAVLILVGRTALPPEESWEELVRGADTDELLRHRISAVRRMRSAGATVHTVAADVTVAESVRGALGPVLAQHGRVDTVVHAAGVLHDALIALRDPARAVQVIDSKARGALVLARELEDHPPRRWVLFSSVSSILGLAGQADYSAANAFLDSFAARLGAAGSSSVVAINWNAWQDVGMAVAAANLPAPPPRPRPPDDGRADRLLDDIVDGGDTVSGTVVLSRAGNWLVGEHVVRGGDAVVPGTGHVELMRELVEAARPGIETVELRNVAFLAPFVVRRDEQRALNVRFDRTDELIAVFAENELEPNVTAEVAGAPTPRPMPIDVDRVRSRCTVRAERFDGYMEQPFMDFGPRWGVLRAMELGHAEALFSIAVPAQFRGELDVLRLHPAVLDMATGMAHDLVPRVGSERGFFVPLSYGRITSYAPLPAEALSHVRLRSGSSADIAVFDVTVCSPDGVVAVDITDFTMRRVDPGFSAAPTATVPGRAAEFRLDAPVTDAIRAGMLPAEGVDALDRILAHDLGSQVVASSVDLERWLEQVEAQSEPVETDNEVPTGYGRPQLSAAFEEPATPIEADLARTWRGLLGVEHIGRNDDFFELGGQSLIAMRLFAWIRREYQIEMPLATLFEAPTISQCAKVIAAQLGLVETPLADASDDAVTVRPDLATVAAGTALMPRPPSARSLVQIASAGRGQPFFIVHGAGGNILFLWGLARALAGDRPIYGFQAMGVNAADQVDESVEAMASRYVAELVAAHDGPYLLGGYSGGGVITLEMARQLQALGHEVTHVVLFDSVPTDQTEWPKLTMRLGHLAGNVRTRGASAITVKTVFGVHGYKLISVRNALTRAAAGEADQRGEVANLSLGFVGVEGFVNLFEPLSKIFARYRVAEYDVDVTVYQAREIAGLHRSDYYWSDHVRGSLTTEIVEGDHHSMFHPRYIPDLAAKVRHRLAEVAADQR